MNTFISHTLAALIGSTLMFNVAMAQEKTPTDTDSVAQSLLDRGYQQLSDGLYANNKTAGKSLIAINAAGHQALALQVQAELEIFKSAAQTDGISTGEQRIMDRLQANIDRLQAVSAKDSQANYGTCLTPQGATLYAAANSTGGTSADSTSVNALDFGPITPTDNYAEAATEYSFSSNSNVGASAASASTSHAMSCYAYGYSYVICPGETQPGVSAFASSTSSRPRCGFLPQ